MDSVYYYVGPSKYDAMYKAFGKAWCDAHVRLVEPIPTPDQHARAIVDAAEANCPECGLPHPSRNPYCFCRPIERMLSKGEQRVMQAALRKSVKIIDEGARD